MRNFSSIAWRLPLIALLSVVVVGCSGSDDKEVIEGERVPVLVYDTGIKADPSVKERAVRLPETYTNEAWPQAGGYPDHAMHHLAVNAELEIAWKSDFGGGTRTRSDLLNKMLLSDRRRLMTPPIVADGTVFIMDSNSVVSAFEEIEGDRQWRIDLKSEEDEEDGGIFGGGLAYSENRVFVTTGFGDVFALSADSGEVIWKSSIRKPLRGAPTVGGKQVYAVSFDNQLYMMSAETGDIRWVHEGFLENAGLLGAGSPAVSGGLVVVPFSSGELYALRTDNGRVAWSDTLMRTGLMTPMAALSDIDARPIVDGNTVYSVSNGGRMAAIELRSGDRIWERNIAAHESPWLAGDFLFLVTDANEVVCLSKIDGKIYWVTKLPRYGNEEERTEALRWSGPVLVSDRLIVTSSHGYAASVSPYTGKFLGRVKLDGAVVIPPVVSNNSLFYVTENAKLIAMR